MDAVNMTKKEQKALEKERKRQDAYQKIKQQEKLSFWTLFRYKYLTTYFAKKFFLAIFRYVLLVGLCFVILNPYLSKIFTSIMSRDDFVNVSVHMLARYPTLDTYKAIIQDNGYFQALLNTSVLSLMCAVIQTLTCTVVGYGFAKFNFKGKKILFVLVIFTMIVPHETIQSSMNMKFTHFDIWNIFSSIGNFFKSLWTAITTKGGFGAWGDKIGASIDQAVKWNTTVEEGTILGAPLGYIRGFLSGVFGGDITGINMMSTSWPFAILSLTCLGFKNGLFIYIMRQYFNGVPDELEEAAYVDGAGVYKTFTKIIMPMSTTMLVTIFMFAFAWQWSDSFYTGMFLKQNVLLPTIATKIPKSLDTNYAAQNAFETAIRNTSGLLILLPLVILYLFAQRTMIEGVERSGITG